MTQELLGDDPRFKTTELNEVDKEDIFSDFVTELAKKEKEEVGRWMDMEARPP